MSDLERAKLIPVSGNNDTPDMNNAVDVQFNPVTLKVNLSNTLKANTNQGNSRATQFVDKSSSTLTVELMFDTTYIEAASGNGASGDSSQSSSRSQIEQGSDVRLQTKKIADKFIKPVESGSQMQAPSRVLFQWGSFEFIGMVQSYDETLDFFSPKGRPLRATVSLKLSEDRYQFRSNDSAAQDAEQTPSLSFTGNGAGSGDPGGGSDAGNGAAAPNQNVNPVPGSSKDGPGSWRDNAMFNGIESPRLPSAPSLALPTIGMSASSGFGISGGAGIGSNLGFSSSGGSASPSTTAKTAAPGSGTTTSTTSGSSAGKAAAGTPATAVTPAFKFGNSAALGTRIPGAFSPTPNTGLKASSLQQGSLQLRAPSGGAESRCGTGTTAARTASTGSRTTGSVSPRLQQGVSVAALLKNSSDSGVGFD